MRLWRSPYCPVAQYLCALQNLMTTLKYHYAKNLYLFWFHSRVAHSKYIDLLTVKLIKWKIYDEESKLKKKKKKKIF